MVKKTHKLILLILNIVIFLNLPQFFYSMGILHIVGYIYIFLFLIISLFIYSTENKKYYVPKLFFYWAMCYILFATFSLLFISELNSITWKVYYMLIFNILTIYIYFSLYLLDDVSFSNTLKIMPYLTIVASLLTIASYIEPMLFMPLDTFLSFNDHRAIGTYINANVAGNALNFLLIISILNVKKNYRIFFILIVGIAIISTFSRSNILMYLVIVLILPFFKSVRLMEVLLVFGLFFLSLLFLINNVDFLRSTLSLNISNDEIQRLMFFIDNQGASSIQDGSATHRLKVAGAAIDYFTSNPVFGAGIGITRIWEDTISTHNTYLSLLAEYGFFGIVILVLLLYAITKNLLISAHKDRQQLGVLFVIYILFTSLFTHNTLDSGVKLGMFALIMAISSREYHCKKSA